MEEIQLNILGMHNNAPKKPRVWLTPKPKGCEGCPLYADGFGFSAPEGEGTIPLLILAEALGEHEEREGKPLRPYAESGALFERVVRRAGFDRKQFIIYNTVNCRPPNNELSGMWYRASAIEQCRQYVDEVVKTYKPKAILALGGVALAALTGLYGEKQSIAYTRGYILHSARYDIPVIASFHPSFVNRGNRNLMPVLIHDLQRPIS